MSTYAARRLKWFCTSALGRTAWVLGALVAATPVAAQDATQGRALLVRASEHFGQIDGLCAEFEQTMVVPLLGSEVRSRGQLCQRPPHFFAMDFTDPAGDRIVADGTYLWIYYPSSQPGQVLRTSLSTTGAMDFHREFLADPFLKYDVTFEGQEQVDGRRSERIRLIPKDGTGYVRATVWIGHDDALLRRVEIEQEGGRVRRVDLAAIETNPRFTSEVFHFDVPEGARVVSMDGMVGGR